MKKTLSMLVLLLIATVSAWAQGNTPQITVATFDNGAVAAQVGGENVTEAAQGTVVTLIVSPAEGYRVDQRAVTIQQYITGDQSQTPLTAPGLETPQTLELTYNATTGTYSTTFTMPGKNVYVSGVVFVEKTSLADAVVTGVELSYVYTGQAIEPVPTVTVGNAAVPATEYTVAYANNTDVGTATLTITANANSELYKGSKQVTFQITEQVVGSKTVYLYPNIWDVDGVTEQFAAYIYGDNLVAAWYAMNPVADTPYYQVTLPDNYSGLIFARMESGTALDWSNVWNQTVDIDFTQVADQTLFTITAWHQDNDDSKPSTVEAGSYVTPTTFTATFKNSIGWSNVYAYTYNPETLGSWPGTQMTLVNGVLTISFQGVTAPTNIIFNNGNGGEGNQTGDLVFENGKEYDFGGTAQLKYYIVGTMTDGGIKPDYEMTLNTQAAEGVTEYMFTPLALTTATQFKVVSSTDGTNITDYFPDGMGNSFGENGEIQEDGNYTIYFRPAYDGPDDWFYNAIYAQKIEEQPEQPTSGEGSYIIPSGMNAGKELNYTWAFTQVGMDVTVTFALTGNTDDIVGLVDGYVFDKTGGFAEIEGLTHTWTDCTEGQVLTAAHKWMFAEGDFVTPDFTYTVKEYQDGPVARTVDVDVVQGWATFVPAFNVTIPEGTTVYVVTAIDAENATVTAAVLEMTVIPAGMPVLLSSETTPVTFTETFEEVGAYSVQNLLKAGDGTTAFALTNNIYSLSEGNFYLTEGTIPADKAYLQLPAGVTSAPASLSIVIDGSTTGIEHIAQPSTLDAQPIYDLSGRRVDAPRKGVYILNGKKIVMK